MNEYIAACFSSDDRFPFFYLFRVEKYNDPDGFYRSKQYYSIKKILVNNETGPVYFIERGNTFGWQWKSLAKYMLDYHKNFFVENKDTLLEFDSDEEALLWFKLNY